MTNNEILNFDPTGTPEHNEVELGDNEQSRTDEPQSPASLRALYPRRTVEDGHHLLRVDEYGPVPSREQPASPSAHKTRF